MNKLSQLLSIYKENEIDAYLKAQSGYDLTEKNLSYIDISSNWKFLGGNSSNGSNVSMLKNGEKGLIERITNAIDTVIEKEKINNCITKAESSKVIIKSAFPKFYENRIEVINGETESLNCKDACDQVVLVVNDGSRSNKPTFDIIDKGTGITGEEFKSTILSINHGNKLSSEKSYLIGAFGQGGSTSLPFTYATIIISKKDNKYYFTIIKGVELNDYKNIVYVYFTQEGEIPEIENDIFKENYLTDFLQSNSGTLVRMIETDISKRFRDNEVTKPGMLGDYINTELFNAGLPVKLIDNRKDYANNAHLQNRYSYGSFLKLQTSKYVKKEYSGIIEIYHNERPYEINYFVLLPKDEAKWGSEYECKKVFEQFNVYYEPILYTVNGQTITTERYIKINNSGLNFLRYRLLVVINLDVLGIEKYKFFTSDRAQIKDTDLTHGLLDNVIKTLTSVGKLKEINSIIAEKSISSNIDQNLLDEVSKEVKSQYNKYLKNGSPISGGKKGIHYGATDEEIYEDHIESMKITSEKNVFYKDEIISFVNTTHAQKHVNLESLIYVYVDDKPFYDFQCTHMNGRIQYNINPGIIKCGVHSIQFSFFPKNNTSEAISTQKVSFEVLDEKVSINGKKNISKELDLDIKCIDESSLICNISKNEMDKKIEVVLCLDTDELRSEIYGVSSSTEDIAIIKNTIIKPVVLFVLFYGEKYDNLENDEDKNKVVISFIKAFIIANKSK